MGKSRGSSPAWPGEGFVLIRVSNRIPLARINPASLRLFVPAICVLSLLIGYMIVCFPDRPRREDGDIETVRLPYADFAMPDEGPDPERLVINVLQEGTMIASGNVSTDQDVQKLLLLEARVSRNADGTAECQLLIRADERTPFKHVMKIINWCRDANVRIYRLSFAIHPEW
jgi:biopolymer transport protein ExbD